MKPKTQINMTILDFSIRNRADAAFMTARPKSHNLAVYHIAKHPAVSCEIVASPLGIQRIFNLRPSPSFTCILHTDLHTKEILEWFESYANKTPLPPQSLAWDIHSLTSFQNAVLEAMSRISFSETISYQTMAQHIGCPLGARAVGNACNKNPLPLLIPCHRVLAARGKLGGFAYGGEVKKVLLGFERSTPISS